METVAVEITKRIDANRVRSTDSNGQNILPRGGVHIVKTLVLHPISSQGCGSMEKYRTLFLSTAINRLCKEPAFESQGSDTHLA